MNSRKFYEDHKNFSYRTLHEYYISPGIKCKFDLLKDHINSERYFRNGIDLGCSGNSFLYFLDNIAIKSFVDLARYPLKQYIHKERWHPLCGDIVKLPYQDDTFDFISALDVLEHVRNDELAISEISRIIKKSGIAIITVPHGMKYYTSQDRLIGHYRRYEIQQLTSLFRKYDFKCVDIFGVYGQMMRIADVQSFNPEKIERDLLKLRNRYITNIMFSSFWDIFVRISAKIMKIDAKYQPRKKVMNIAFIFKKL
jgi:SAM-dependent methyltransferase